MNPETVADVSLPEFLNDSHRAPSATARLVHLLARHRKFLVPFTAVYIVTIITLHDVMQQPAYWAQGQLSHRSWNNLVTAFAVPILAVFCIWMMIGLRRHARARIASAYLAVTVGLSVLFFHTLLCMNIEVIHFPQYAILAVLLFALTGSFGQTILWGTLCGLVDEGYQYFYLYINRRIYMDFNDVILNSLGIGFGLVMLFIAGFHATRWRADDTPSRPRLFTSAAGIAAGLLAIVSVVMYATGFLRLFASPTVHPWAIVLRRGGPPTRYWSPMNWGKTFHEVQPLEWVLASIVLIAFYAMLDRIRAAKGTP